MIDMNKIIPLSKIIPLLVVLALTAVMTNAQVERKPWSGQQAKAWYSQYDWLTGSDFIPHTAINQLEMWQAETFDTAAIDHDLAFAQSIGFNAMRVFLHHLAWQEDPAGFKIRMDKYLAIASAHGIVTMFVFFDDCWNDVYRAGKQPDPKPGVHNSGWLRDPGGRFYNEPALIDTLKEYVTDVLTTFKHDKRILCWDLYNEPGNSNYGLKSLGLLEKEFHWARRVDPDQPLTAGVWNSSLTELNHFQLTNSDLITYHNYDPPAAHQAAIDTLKKYDRPMICTEYMARRNNSLFSNIMPLLKREHIGAINWGLVTGKTNTMYAWGTPIPDGSEPKLWFHDIVRPDGRPFSEDEIRFIKGMTGR